MNTIWDRIKNFAQESGDIITTGDVERMNINRGVIKSFVVEGKLTREAQGIYSLSDGLPDEYRLLQLRSCNVIYSYGTALFLHGMSDRVPQLLDVTVPQGYNVSKIKKDHAKIRFHYVDKEIWKIGLEELKTPLGGVVQVYDRERCICDIVGAKQLVDLQLYSQAIKEYFTSNYDARKIIRYGRIFAVDEKLRTIFAYIS